MSPVTPTQLHQFYVFFLFLDTKFVQFEGKNLTLCLFSEKLTKYTYFPYGLWPEKGILALSICTQAKVLQVKWA